MLTDDVFYYYFFSLVNWRFTLVCVQYRH